MISERFVRNLISTAKGMALIAIALSIYKQRQPQLITRSNTEVLSSVEILEPIQQSIKSSTLIRSTIEIPLIFESKTAIKSKLYITGVLVSKASVSSRMEVKEYA